MQGDYNYVPMPSANISSINELAAISSSLTNHVDEIKRK